MALLKMHGPPINSATKLKMWKNSLYQTIGTPLQPSTLNEDPLLQHMTTVLNGSPSNKPDFLKKLAEFFHLHLVYGANS